ncbi:DUF5985 family protein [Sphingomonas quercus]|uniref:Uncharacterized protein n=1 Tax=Sphingomonas quercus TaxID=2842451 RepID=A0ABS6BIY2_9SPHN|nr:DUF5985 family protein [Sphingomonas quercus]MBU3077572.1 hypothetical protein [Sphingomonas quercus]
MTLLTFISGATTMGYFLSSLFFLRFWRSASDILFLAFAAAFMLMGLGTALLTLSGVPLEERSWIYLLRLTAFLIILAAIVRKNLSTR